MRRQRQLLHARRDASSAADPGQCLIRRGAARGGGPGGARGAGVGRARRVGRTGRSHRATGPFAWMGCRRGAQLVPRASRRRRRSRPDGPAVHGRGRVYVGGATCVDDSLDCRRADLGDAAHARPLEGRARVLVPSVRGGLYSSVPRLSATASAGYLWTRSAFTVISEKAATRAWPIDALVVSAGVAVRLF